MKPETFHGFAELPKEIRDEIWKLCLPRRVVEIDWPDVEWHSAEGFGKWHPYLDSTLRSDCTDDKPQLWLCPLTPTSRVNSSPPVITRVCHESRVIALRTGQLQTQIGSGQGDLFRINAERFWSDNHRDVFHLHWHPFLFGPEVPNLFNPLEHLLSTSGATAAVSICADLLDAIERHNRLGIMRILERRPRWSVCGALVTLHVEDETVAIDSGLWGSLGEERVVLVDAFDVERIQKFWRFWLEHGPEDDPEARSFFGAAEHGVPKIHYLETPEEFLLDLETRWLLDSFPAEPGHSLAVEELRNEVWITKPEDFDGRDDDPRAVDYGDLPGRPFARQLWSPNRDHAWVKDVLSRKPEFVPTIMFRLCTSECPRHLHPLQASNM